MLIAAIRHVGEIERDAALPTLEEALDPVRVRALFRARVPRTSALPESFTVAAARMVAHKPGRRCLIEYRIAAPGLGDLIVLGKIRAGRSPRGGYRRLRALWNAGFSTSSEDAVSVPEPIGVVKALRMWLQRRVEGRLASDVLPGPEGIRVAERIADAIQKLHAAGVPAHRRHTIDDEIAILHRCLSEVAASCPALARRLAALSAACERLGAMLPAPAWCGSHRDFYGDQVLVDGDRLYLIDFDLYCEADPGLDLGNFTGHLTEQSVRLFGDAAALAPIERAMENRFAVVAGADVRWPVRVYRALTLARHVFLSSRLPQRSHCLLPMLELAESAISAAAAEGGHA